VAEEVENPMDQEKSDFPRKGMVMVFGLASSGLDRDDHIA
jgi:hypothetical protein